MPPAASPFSQVFNYIDGLLGVEAAAKLKRVASRLTKKWQKPYHRTCRYINIRIVIILERATYRYIRGYRVTAYTIIVQRLQWEESNGLNLFR